MHRPIHVISDQPLDIAQCTALIENDVSLDLSNTAKQRIVHAAQYLAEKILNSPQPVYGVNTGFGSLYNTNIPADQLGQLQENLVQSHACGMGSEVPDEIVRLMLFLKIQSLCYGHSGVNLTTVERLVALFNEHIYPIVYEMGSLGASGDLAPLAHLSLPLIGLGSVKKEARTISGSELLNEMGWEKILLGPKEGLALLNGTQFMAAYGTWSIYHGRRLLRTANIIAALSLDVFDGRIEAFDQEVIALRAHPGQIEVATEIRRHLEHSELMAQQKKHVQDPYSFRCVPQVHGATAETLRFAEQIMLTEANSVTDNPTVFPDEDKIISSGNFHGQHLALALDFLAIALAELGNISERRIFQLISGARDLPNYLIARPGIHSGMMIPQYTAASLVSQNKQLCTPASVDSITSSNGQEDHVSMGANAAVKCRKVIENVYRVLAIEWLTAAQALSFRRPLRTGAGLEKKVDTFRRLVPFMEEDRVLHHDMRIAEGFVRHSILKI